MRISDWSSDGALPIYYRESDLVKVSILVNQEPVDSLAIIVHRGQAETRGRMLCERLKDLIPRQLFKIAIQAAIGGKVVARETISALRKDVTSKRSEEHTSELQSLMRISYAVFCLNKKQTAHNTYSTANESEK